MAVQRLTVGIFSRDGQDNYKWLVNLLRAAMFQNLVEYVLNVYISSDARSFVNALSQCSFAILYHTKNRGRLNIANVNDSLYDKELEDMKAQLGDDVVVLVDDVADGSNEIRRRMLEEQPLIKECAQDLIVISEAEKQAADLTGSDPRWSPVPTSHELQDEYDSIQNKIYRLKTLMEEALQSSPDPRRENPGPRVGSSSDSETESEGYKSSGTAGSRSYKHKDVESVRTSSAYSSGRSDKSLIRPDQRDGIPARREQVYIPTSEDDGQLQKQKTGGSSRLTSFTCCNKLSDKMVFILIGGSAGILLIILIVILCVAL